MPIINFPSIDNATEEGLVALGGDLEVESILLAYSLGIFPWPISKEFPLAWFSPDPRGILQYNNLHISKSLKKFIKKNVYRTTFNQAFDEIINTCAKIKRSKQDETWITEELIDSYKKLFIKGYAYSVETWCDNELVGGMYGFCMKRLITGESMFYKKDNASKIALISLLNHLHLKEIDWIDTQMLTPVIKSLGGEEISRNTFLKKIKIEQNIPFTTKIFS